VIQPEIALDLKLEDGLFDLMSLSAVDTDDSEETFKFHCQLGSSDVNQPA
jgi:hypothetical protein